MHDIPADFFTQFPNLETVNFSGYPGIVLDLSKNTKLVEVWAWDMPNMAALILSSAPNLKDLYCTTEGPLKYVYVKNGVTFNNLEKNEDTQIIYQ